MATKLTNSGFRNWTPDQLPDLTGKTFVITGANVGLGYETARYLRQAGADLIFACRSEAKARQAIERLEKSPGGQIALVVLDLADMRSIRLAAQDVRALTSGIDGLINNAGIMQTPQQKTADGLEMQFGTNHVGHFLWTQLLLDLVEKAGGRVVVVYSIAHKYGRIHFDDLMLEQGYTPSKAYFQSKLANLMFALELDRRLQKAGARTTCIAAHPGYSDTDLQSTGPRGMLNAVYKLTNRIMAQSAAQGAIPSVLAAAGVEAQRGAYYGPQGLFEARGRVSDALVTDQAQNRHDAEKLWLATEQIIGMPFAVADIINAAKTQ